MNLLLDTQAFLWFVQDAPQLSAPARQRIEAHDSRPFLSVASVWEIAIKLSLGKLQLTQPFEAFIPQQLAINSISLLPITVEHLAVVTTLPFYHRDPFDRLLAAQAQVEELLLVSVDAVFDAYPVRRWW